MESQGQVVLIFALKIYDFPKPIDQFESIRVHRSLALSFPVRSSDTVDGGHAARDAAAQTGARCCRSSESGL